MTIIDQMKYKWLFHRSARIMKLCTKYYEFAKKQAERTQMCEKFMGIDLYDADTKIRIVINKKEGVDFY